LGGHDLGVVVEEICARRVEVGGVALVGDIGGGRVGHVPGKPAEMPGRVDCLLGHLGVVVAGDRVDVGVLHLPRAGADVVEMPVHLGDDVGAGRNGAVVVGAGWAAGVSSLPPEPQARVVAPESGNEGEGEAEVAGGPHRARHVHSSASPDLDLSGRRDEGARGGRC
jgi:hypothetical protein